MMDDLKPLGAVPSVRQMAWHEREYYGFVHFGPNTFSGKEWGDGREDPKIFAPKELDTDQWCRVFRDAGMTGVILTAKHHDGFCLWPSKFSTHTVREAGFDGDVVAQVAKSCRKYGLKFGVYLSPWDRNHPQYGTEEYNDVFVAMLEEVLTNYGDVFEVWFDGANGEGPNGKKQVYDFARFNQTVRKFQPNAVIFSDAGPDIRWVGNEDGFSGETNWGTIDRDRYVPGTPFYKELTEGKMGGTHWVPAECDVSIRKGWFWRGSEDSAVKSTERLMKIWRGSVGRGSNLLLNVPPDDRGLIADVDVKALMEFRRAREEYLGEPVEAVVRGFSRRVGHESYRAEDGDGGTFWVGNPDGDWRLTLDFGGYEEVTGIDVREYLPLGQRVTGWRVFVEGQDGWYEVAQGTTVGWRRLIGFGRVTARKVVFEVTGARSTPMISEIRAFRGN